VVGARRQLLADVTSLAEADTVEPVQRRFEWQCDTRHEFGQRFGDAMREAVPAVVSRRGEREREWY
jgi:hypothetical protein